ncbi:MAG: MBL fold metallo-hydrolase, partial [Clostridia bacterium]|nr:MBL fold metallo-hydrolase [Clostridia bacterium]
MKITWLGQAGLLLETDRATVMIDPYLSDSVVKVNPRNYRRVPVEERFFEVKPDIMIFTHDHLDHFDPETAPRFINNETAVTVLAPTNARALAMKLGVGQNNYVLFDRHTEWTEKGLRFKAVKACHSDSTAIGVIIEDGEKTYYITGDTLYNTEIFADLPQNIDVVFLPIN